MTSFRTRVEIFIQQLTDRNHNPYTRFIILGSTWVLGGKIVISVLSLILNIMLVKLLRLQDVGVYFVLVSLVATATIFSKFGLGQTVIKFVAKSSSRGQFTDTRKIIVYIFLLGLAVSICTGLAFNSYLGDWISIRLFKSSQLSSLMHLAGFLVVFQTMQALASESFRGLKQLGWATIFDSLASNFIIVCLLTMLWFSWGQVDLENAILILVVSTFVGATIAWITLFRKINALPDNETIDGLATSVSLAMIVRHALPILVNNFALIVITQADIWILTALRSANEVAIYGAAAKLVLSVTVPLAIANAVTPPLIAELDAQHEHKRLENLLRTVATLAGIPALFALVFFIFGSREILNLVYGVEYQAGAMVLSLLSLGQAFNVVAGSCGVVLVMTGHQSNVMRITLLSGVVLLVGALFVTPNFGMAGLALVVMFTIILRNLWMLLAVKRYLGIWTHMRWSINSGMSGLRQLIRSPK